MNEFSVDYKTGETLYAARFQLDGNVFVTDGSSDQTWSDPTLYDVTMTEDGNGGHYVGSFDTSGNIVEGVYPVTVYLQTGGSPANGDPPLFNGVMHWSGDSEINDSTLSDQMAVLSAQGSRVLNVYER